MNYLLALASFAIPNILLMLTSKKYLNDWKQRGFSEMFLSWKNTLISSVLFSLVGAVVAFTIGGQWWQIAIVSILGWLVPFIIVTDLSTYKIPKEPSILAYYLPLVFAIPLMWGDKVSYLSFALWFVFPVIFLFLYGLIRGGGFGTADTRLLILAGTGLSWWVGYDWLFFSFVGAAVAQIIFSGVLVLMGKKRVKAVGLDAEAEKKDEVVDDGKKRKQVTPFGPAIIIALWVVAILAIYFDRTACSVIDGVLCL